MMRAMQMLPMQNPVQTNAQRTIDPDNSFINAYQDTQKQSMDQDKFAYQQQMDATKLSREDDDIERRGFEAMMKAPQNAPMIAQQYNIPFTPEIQELLKEPMKMQRVLEGAAMVKQMGIANPQAVQSFMRSYLQQGDFEPALGAVEGMDLRAPMSPYQEGMLGQQQQRTGIMANNAANMQAYRTHQMNKTPASQDYTKGGTRPALHPSVPTQIRMEAEALYKMQDSGKLQGDFDFDTPLVESEKFKRLMFLNEEAQKYINGGVTPAPMSANTSNTMSQETNPSSGDGIMSFDEEGNQIFNFDQF